MIAFVRLMPINFHRPTRRIGLRQCAGERYLRLAGGGHFILGLLADRLSWLLAELSVQQLVHATQSQFLNWHEEFLSAR
jgi:hypothetical protein